MHTILKECNGCDDLQAVYDKIECTLLYLANNKNNSLKYNVSVFFDEELFKDLARYKKIIYKRIRNCNYPCSTIKTSELIARASFLAFRDGNCSRCENCFPEIPIETTSTTSTTTSATP